ncbi:MAG: ABC-2 family transporter protein [Phycisphaerae bacterium]
MDAIIRAVVALVHVAAELMGLWVLFSNTRSLNGWTVWQTVALLGVFRVMVASIRLFIAPNMRQTMEDIRNGTLDFVLLRPVATLFLASFRRVVMVELFDVLLGLSMTSVAVVKLRGTISVAGLASFVLLVCAGVLICYAIWLSLATLSFWFTRVANIEMIFWNLFEVGRYPVDIYPPMMRRLLTYVIPVAFITTVPAQAACQPIAPLKLLFGLAVGSALLAAAARFWRYGLRHYSGASA